ncbi:Amastin surface glycofamily protein [Leishmania donovani]|uniref:Amastin surface glycofamily protein n=1 Tax=Leishmania donovani TaxID=5661 RepID=A0A504XPM1_LEIDO|nr:Amastin surface glycofamily protein [Leishmania donovani]
MAVTGLVYAILQFIAFFFVLVATPIDMFRSRKDFPAFAVISIFVYGTAFVLGLIALCCCACLRWVCLALNVAGIATLCIVWASMVVIYYKDEGFACSPFRDFFSYGAGFALLVVAWCLDIINVGLLLLPFEATLSLGSAKEESSTRSGEEAVK